MLEFFLSFITIENITNLPGNVLVPGLIILALLVYRGIRALLSLKLFRVFSSIIMFFIVAVILSRFGTSIALMLETQPPAPN